MSYSKEGFLLHSATNIDEPCLLKNLNEINESAETKAKCLEILSTELKKLNDIEPCLEENFLLLFLRVSKFDPLKAYQRILKYFKQQDKVLNALRKMSLSLQKARSVNYVWTSPYRLKDNSLLVLVLGGKVDYVTITYAERFYLDLLAVHRIVENPVNQVAGVTVLFDNEGFNVHSLLAHTPGWCFLFVETLMSVFPTRVKALHLVNIPTLFSAIYNICYPLLPKKMKTRVFLHRNKDWKSLHAAIPPDVLPEEYGGSLKFDSFVNMLVNIEDLEDNFRKMLQYGSIKTKVSRQSFRPICENK